MSSHRADAMHRPRSVPPQPRPRLAVAAVRPPADRPEDGLVMVCDVDLGVPDATRTHTVEVARGFASQGFRVDLVARGPDPGLPGVAFHAAAPRDAGRRERVVGINRTAVRVLRDRRAGATCCYVRHEWSHVAVLAAARALGYRLVTQVDDVAFGRGYEGGDVGRAADYVRRAAAILMGRLVHGVVAVTPEIKGLLVEQFRVPHTRVAALPNGADVDRIRPLERAEAIAAAGLEPNHDYVVFIGRFAEWVDFDTILGGFAVASREHPGARLLLVGDGNERDAVDATIARLGISDRVVRMGFVSDPGRVLALLGASSVALSANRPAYRARIGVSPVKLAEYLAAGRPIVATDIPGVREAVEGAGAGIVTPVDAGAFGAAISELLRDPRRRAAMGEAGRRAAVERYSWRSVVERTVPLFGGSRP